MGVEHIERPAAGAAEGALVFLHGYYGHGEDFRPFLDKVDPDRRLHGFLPQGPCELGEGRSSWWVTGDPDPFGRLEPVAAWLDSLPFPAEQIVLGGWSQGAVAAYALGLAAERPRPAGLLALGGSLPQPFVLDLSRPLPPVAIAHGRNDQAVPVSEARRARDLLVGAGAQVVYLETDIGHEIDQAVVPQLRGFVAALPGQASV